MNWNDEALENAARHYCANMGADPDKMIGHGAEPNEQGYVPAIMMYSPQWQLVVKQLKSAIIMAESVQLYNAEVRYKPTADTITTLRVVTGYGMMECKKALVETKGNFEEAVEYLKGRRWGSI